MGWDNHYACLYSIFCLIVCTDADAPCSFDGTETCPCCAGTSLLFNKGVRYASVVCQRSDSKSDPRPKCWGILLSLVALYGMSFRATVKSGLKCYVFHSFVEFNLGKEKKQLLHLKVSSEAKLPSRPQKRHCLNRGKGLQV